jgi:hypothetical protein
MRGSRVKRRRCPRMRCTCAAGRAAGPRASAPATAARSGRCRRSRCTPAASSWSAAGRSCRTVIGVPGRGHEPPKDGRLTNDPARAALKRAGLRRSVRFHDLRHSAAAAWLAAGRPMMYVQRQLGHTDFGTTIRSYGHLEESFLPDAAERVEAAILERQPLSPTKRAVPIGLRAWTMLTLSTLARSTMPTGFCKAPPRRMTVRKRFGGCSGRCES